MLSIFYSGGNFMDKLVKKYPLGAIPSHISPKDYKVADFVIPTKVPSDYMFSGFKDLPVYDQGQVGSCVSHALSETEEFLEYRERGVKVTYSKGFVYLNRYAHDGTGYSHSYLGEGMVTREACQSALTDGVPEYSLFPYNVPFSLRASYPITPVIFSKAAPQKIGGYFSVSTMDQLKQAIFNNGPVILCVPVYDNFYRVTNTGNIDKPTSSTIYGYHATVCGGYSDTERRLICKNSWSANWGDAGYFYLSYDYPWSEVWGISNYPKIDRSVTMWIGKKDAIINGILIKNALDAAPYIDAATGRTYLPVRFVTENLGCEVQWVDAEKKIIVKL